MKQVSSFRLLFDLHDLSWWVYVLACVRHGRENCPNVKVLINSTEVQS